MSLGKKLLPSSDPLGLISEERMAELREEARANVKKRLQAKAEKEFLASEEKRVEREADPKPEYEMRGIIIDVAEHTSVIRIDGQHFFYGQRYEVTKPVFDQLSDIISRGWAHEKEISVPTRRIHSRNLGTVLHGADANSGVQF